MSESTPTICDFVPLPWQHKVIVDVRKNFDYNLGTHEVLLSGSVGSSKSILLAHLIVTHCILNPNAHAGIGRRTLPSLRETLVEVIRHHIGDDFKLDYNGVTSKFIFPNGSVLRPFSWADAHYKKFRSHEFSAFGIEELTENEDPEFYHEILARVGRLRHVNEKIMICATNPDDPEHWAHKHFFTTESPRRHKYLSSTANNPYLPRSYIEQLKELYDPKMYRRMVLGEWIPIRTEVVYHQYDPELNKSKTDYKVNPNTDIHWAWDFNIGDGKPLSSCFFQHDGKTFHVYKDLVIEGLRTEDMLEEAWNKGLLDHDVTYIINGDATGKRRDTRSKHNDWEIIKIWLSNTKNRLGKPIQFRMDVPLTNPRVRERHNIVNAQLHNSLGERRVIVYPGAPIVHEGLMLTKLKPGADIVEDDSKSYQHVTTSLGYGIVATLRQDTKSTVTAIRR